MTVNAGVRVDVIDRNDAAFNVQTMSSTEIGPRFGINYLLTKDGRTAVRGSWVRVADVLAQTTQSAGTNASGVRDLYDTNLDGTFETTFVTPGVSARSTDRVLDDARHQPYMDEWIVGARRQLPGLVTLDASVVRREFRDRTALVEINGIYENGVFKGYKNESFNDIYKITNNVWNWPVYTFFELQGTKQTERFQALASYTHQWRHLAGTWQPNDPASFIQPDAFPNSKGIGSTTSTFESQNSLSSSPSVTSLQVQTIDDAIRLGASYRVLWDIVLATNYTFQSGLWSGPIVTRLAAPDPRFGPPTVTLSNGRVVSNPLATTIRFANQTRDEGQFTLPAMHIWNVRIGKDIRFGARRLEAALDVFNVTNHDAFYLLASGANQTFNPLYGQGASTSNASRRADLGAVRLLRRETRPDYHRRVVSAAHRQRRIAAIARRHPGGSAGLVPSCVRVESVARHQPVHAHLVEDPRRVRRRDDRGHHADPGRVLLDRHRLGVVPVRRRQGGAMAAGRPDSVSSTTSRRLHAARDGTLWIGVGPGVVALKDGAISEYPALAGQFVEVRRGSRRTDLDGRDFHRRGPVVHRGCPSRPLPGSRSAARSGGGQAVL